jgi:SM-20-related protein
LSRPAFVILGLPTSDVFHKLQDQAETAQMQTPEKKIKAATISDREIFVCDHFIENATVIAVGEYLKTLRYSRSETSLEGMAPTASSAEVPGTPLMAGFIAQLGQAAHDMFPTQRFRAQRAYINQSVYGDVYQMHRDLSDVTVLYYANLNWETDWGGETIYFDDDCDAQLVVSPRPGRLLVARGNILHRGSVPTRDCPEPRFTIAYKLRLRNNLGGL